MAAQQSLHGQPTALPGAMPLDRLQAIGAAGWREPAARADEGGDEPAVEADQSQHPRSDHTIQKRRRLNEWITG